MGLCLYGLHPAAGRERPVQSRDKADGPAQEIWAAKSNAKRTQPEFPKVDFPMHKPDLPSFVFFVSLAVVAVLALDLDYRILKPLRPADRRFPLVET